MTSKILVQGVQSTLHPLYRTYHGMKNRCYNQKLPQYKDYGGRGVIVCDRWLKSFEDFVNDMGVRPVGCSLDRIDNSKGYEPSNCRWATREQQNNNQRTRKINNNNKTGVIGISLTKYGTYRVDKFRKYYGSYSTMDEALVVLNNIGDVNCRSNEDREQFNAFN